MIKETSMVKKDTLENWNKAKNFIPRKNEVIIYIDIGMKIGDGITKLSDLPFINQTSYKVQGQKLIINTGGI